MCGYFCETLFGIGHYFCKMNKNFYSQDSEKENRRTLDDEIQDVVHEKLYRGDTKKFTNQNVGTTRTPICTQDLINELKKLNYKPIDLSSVNLKFQSKPSIFDYFDLIDEFNSLLRLVNQDNRVKSLKQNEIYQLISSLSNKQQQQQPRLCDRLPHSPNYYDTDTVSEEYSELE